MRFKLQPPSPNFPASCSSQAISYENYSKSSNPGSHSQENESSLFP